MNYFLETYLKNTTRKTFTLFSLFIMCFLFAMPVRSDSEGGSVSSEQPDTAETPQPACDGGCCNGGGDPDAPAETSSDPIVYFTGQELHREVDMVIEGHYPIVLERSYDNQSIYDSPLGYGWAFRQDRRLFQYNDNSVVIRFGCGFKARYVYSANAYSQVETNGQMRGELTEDNGSFTFTYLSGKRDEYDHQGRLVAEVRPNGERLVYAYSTSKQPLIGTSPYALNPDQPMVVAYHYQLLSIKEQLADGSFSGNEVIFTYDSTTGRLATATDHVDRQVIYQHDEHNGSTQGNLIQVTGLEGIVSQYDYTDDQSAASNITHDWRHNLTSIQVGNETPTINEYNTQDKVFKQTRGRRVLQFDYDPDNLGSDYIRTQVTETVVDDAEQLLHSLTTKYTFNAVGKTTLIDDALGHRSIYSYYEDSQHLQRSERWHNSAASGQPVQLSLIRAIDYSYNTTGRLTSRKVYLIEDSDNDTANDPYLLTTWTPEGAFDKNVSLIDSRDPDTVFYTEYGFDYENGEPTRINRVSHLISGQPGSGPMQTFEMGYNTRGQQTSITHPDDVQKITAYDNGSLYPTSTYYQQEANILDTLKTEFVFDDQGRLTSVEDARHYSTTYTYDHRNRLKDITNALNEKNLYTYEDQYLTQIEMGREGSNPGQILKFGYTAEGWVETIEQKTSSDAEPEAWLLISTFDYDSAGNQIRRTSYRDGNAYSTHFEYDALHRVVRTVDPDNNATHYVYDAMHRLVEKEDALQRQVHYRYDGDNRLLEVVKDSTGVAASTTMTYDAAGNVLSVTDAEQSTTVYTYDRLSRRISTQMPLLETDTVFYNTLNQVDYTLNARQQRTQYHYYPWGGVHQVEYFNGPDTSSPLDGVVTYSYDHSSNMTSVTDTRVQSSALYTYTHDALNRIDIEQLHYLPSAVLLDHDYDRWGNRTQWTLNDGSVVQNTADYDILNQLESVVLNGKTYGFSYHRDAGLLKQLQYPSGITEDYTFKNSGALESFTTQTSALSVLEHRFYQYDSLYNIDTFSSARDNGDYDYQYDRQNRLTQVLPPAFTTLPQENYEYDLVGNRENPSAPSDYDYNANHQIQQSPDNTSYGFDDDGNMISRADGAVFTYDTTNRLKAFTKDSTQASYQYDPFSRRLNKTVDGQTTWFVWDGGRVLAEYDWLGQRNKRYGYLPGSLSPDQMEDASGIYSVHKDHLDTPIFITNDNETVVWEARYEAFGKTIIHGDPDGDGQYVEYQVRFPGQYFDKETNTNYNYYRMYDPTLGRYIQSDPIGLNGGINTYGYVGGNPLSFVDLLGLCKCGKSGIEGDIQRMNNAYDNNKGKACVVSARDSYREFYEDPTIGNGLWNDPLGTRFDNLLPQMESQGYADSYQKISSKNSNGVPLSVSQRSSYSGLGAEIESRGKGIYAVGVSGGGHVTTVTYDGSNYRIRDQGTVWDKTFSSASDLDSGMSDVMDWFSRHSDSSGRRPYKNFPANTEIYTLCQCPK